MIDKMDAIVFESGHFYAVRCSYGYDIYKNGVTGATRVARIGYKGSEGLERVKTEIARRMGELS